jgi:hypothetical protein
MDPMTGKRGHTYRKEVLDALRAVQETLTTTDFELITVPDPEGDSSRYRLKVGGEWAPAITGETMSRRELFYTLYGIATGAKIAYAHSAALTRATLAGDK